jgi:hypothetical protein
MDTTDLEIIKKHYTKLHKHWSDEEIERQALETLNKYILLNKDKLADSEK